MNMAVVKCSCFIFLAIFVGPVIGDFKSSSLALQPEFDIGDSNSVIVRAYPCKLWWFWRYQLLTINRNDGSGEKELGWASARCADFNKIKHELSQGYIGLGDAIYVSAVEGSPIMVIFKMKNRSCQKKILTDQSWALIDKPQKQSLNAKECAAELKKIRPRKVHLGSRQMVVRLDPQSVSKAIQSNIKNIPQLTAQTQSQAKKTSGGAGGAAVVAVAAGEAGAAGAARAGGAAGGGGGGGAGGKTFSFFGWNKQPEMSMVSLDSSDLDNYVAKWDEGVGWYLSDKLVMTLQNMYLGQTCIRVVVIWRATPDDNEDIEIAKFKTTCGKVRGLTMYPDFIKYKKAFVFVLENDNEASGYFNMNSGNCLLRKYAIEGNKVTVTDVNQNDEQCKSFMSDTTGTILNKEYKDSEHEFLDGNVYKEYVSNNSSPKEEDEREKQEENAIQNENAGAGGFFQRLFGG